MTRLPKREQLRHRIPSRNRDFSRYFTTLIQPPDWSYERDRDTYTYTFQSPRPQRDAVLRLINKTIRDLMHDLERGVAMCNTNFRVSQSTSAPPIWPPCGSHEIKLYTFKQDYEEFPVTVPVSIMPPEDALEVSKIRVRISSEWIPIQTWLIEMAENSRAIRARSPESIQYFWNKRNGRTFNFAKLPAEIRCIILRHAMAPEGEIYPLSGHHCKSVPEWDCVFTAAAPSEHARIFMGFGYNGGRSGYKSKDGEVARPPCQIAPETHPRIHPPCTALLFVSRWLTDEALKAGWNTPVKCFIDANNFVHTLYSKSAPIQQYNALGRIELSFTTGDWLRFFGLEFAPWHGLAPSKSTGRDLARLVDTTRLTIRFRDPDDGWVDHPWGEETEMTACQTVMIDWIMTLAFPDIRHIARLQLTGCIRKSQRERWEGLLQQERAGVPHGFDYVAAANTILETDATQP